MPNNTDFGSRLKALRAAKAEKLGRRKIPQREIASQLNISPGAYASWESGRTRPDVSMLPKLADYFAVSIDFLLGHTGGIQPNLESVLASRDLIWSLRRPAQTENEQRGIEAWQQLVQGEAWETVAKALRVRAKREVEGYVQDVVYTDMISIEHLPQDKELANRVRKRFKLREVVVVPAVQETSSLIRNILLGEAARFYFKTHVHDGAKIGLAGGYSVSRMVYSLRRGECRNIDVYPLAISPVTEAVSLDANSLVGALAYRHDGYSVRGYALQYASRLAWKTANDIKPFALTLSILSRAKNVDIAFMGLGIFGRRRASLDLLSYLLESAVQETEILKRGAVGDILYHPVDKEGKLVSPEISNLICSNDLDDLRTMTQLGMQVVVIASRQEKKEIALAAIRAGYANVFIIDSELAEALLNSEA